MVDCKRFGSDCGFGFGKCCRCSDCFGDLGGGMVGCFVILELDSPGYPESLD